MGVEPRPIRADVIAEAARCYVHTAGLQAWYLIAACVTFYFIFHLVVDGLHLLLDWIQF